MNFIEKHIQKRILSGGGVVNRLRRVNFKGIKRSRRLSLLIALVMVVSMVPFFSNSVRAIDPIDLSDYKPSVSLYLDDYGGLSGAETTANVWVSFSEVSGDRPTGVFYVEIELPGVLEIDATSGANTQNIYFDPVNEVVIIIFSDLDILGAGSGLTRAFRFVPSASYVTPNGTQLDYLAKLYFADEINYDSTSGFPPEIDNPQEVQISDKPVTSTTNYLVEADVNWRATAGVSSTVNPLIAYYEENLTGKITFAYNPVTNYGARTTGIERASELVYSDVITIPDGVVVTGNMVGWNTTLSGGGALPSYISADAVIEYHDGLGNLIDNNTSPVKTITVTYTVTNSENPDKEIPSITSTLTITDAKVNDAPGPFDFASGTLNGTVTGIVDGAPGVPSSAAFSAARGGLSIKRQPAPVEPEGTAQTQPTITKGPTAMDLTAQDSKLAYDSTTNPHGLPTEITFELSNFGNALISEESGYVPIAKDFKVVDNFEQNGELLFLKDITIGAFDNCAGVTLTVTIEYYDLYDDVIDSEELTVTDVDLAAGGTTLSLVDSAGKQIKQIEFYFGDVPEGFKIGDDEKISLTFDTPDVSTGKSDVTIVNLAAVSYAGATYTNGKNPGDSIIDKVYRREGRSSPFYLERKSPIVEINKTVRNVTTNTSGSGTLFSPGDEVEYTLSITNRDRYAITNLKIEDYASEFLDFSGYIVDSKLVFTAVDNTGLVTGLFTVVGPDLDDYETPYDPVDGYFNRIVWTSSSGSPGYTLAAGRTLTITYKAKIDENVDPEETIENKFFVTWADWWHNEGVIGGGEGTSPSGSGSNYGQSSFTSSDHVLRAGINKDVIAIERDAAYLSLGATPYNVTDGDVITYELTIANLSTISDIDLVNPVVVDDLPDGLVFVSDLTSAGDLYAAKYGQALADLTVTGSRLVWEFTGSLAKGETWTLVFTVIVDFHAFAPPGYTTVPTNRVNTCYLLPYPEENSNDAGSHKFTYDLSNNNEWGRLYTGTYNQYGSVKTHAVENNYRVNIQQNRMAEIEKRAFKKDSISGDPIGAGWITETAAGTAGNRLKAGDTVIYKTTFKSTGTNSINVFRFADILPENETFVPGSVKVQFVPPLPGTALDVAVSSQSLSGGKLLVNFADQELKTNDSIVVTFETTVNSDAAENTMNASDTAKYRGMNSAAFYTREFVGTLAGTSGANNNTYRSAAYDAGVDDWDNNTGTNVRYQANCYVYYNDKLIIPEIEKKAYYISTSSGGVETWKPYENEVLKGEDEIGWVVTIKNLTASTTDMISPYVLDLLPKQLEYVEGSTYTGSSGSTGTAISVASKTKYNDQDVLVWELGDLSANGGSFTFCFKTVIASSFVGQLTNHAYLVPQERFIEHGPSSILVDLFSPVNDFRVVQMEGSTGVKSSANVMVAGNAAIASVKSVTGKLNGVTHTADPGEYITVDREGEFTYSLTVINLGSKPRDNMVIIDRLPEPDDWGLVADEARLSGFTVELVKGVTAAGAFKIEYSIETEFDDDDWAGKPATKWVDEGDVGNWSEIRSFRVIYNTALAPGVSRSIEVTAKAEDGVQPGPIAWNSFGYEFDTEDINGARTCLEPLKVGVTVGDAKDGKLEIAKTLTRSASYNVTFYFDITGVDDEGNVVYNSKTEGYPNGVPVTVNAGATSGKSVTLVDLPYGKYSVTERLLSGYTPSYSNNGEYVLNGGVLTTLRVTNSYDPGEDPPPPDPPGTTTPPGDDDDDDDDDDDGGDTPPGVVVPVVDDGDDGDPETRVDMGESNTPAGTDTDVMPVPTSPGNTLVEDGDGWIELDEDGVPLGRWSYDPDTDMWLFDPFPPLAGALPQTGLVQTQLLLVFGLYLTGVGVLLKTRARKRSKSN